MTLRGAGYFRELRHGLPDGPSLIESRREIAHPDEQFILAYLRAAPVLAIAGTRVDDYLDPASEKVAILQTSADGQWAWPGDLAYYVERYHVALPEEFIEHLRENSWAPPELSHEQLTELCAELASGPPAL